MVILQKANFKLEPDTLRSNNKKYLTIFFTLLNPDAE